MRLFVAIDIPAAVRSRMAAIRGDLAAMLGDGASALRWVRPEGVHLTLRFLGEVAPDSLPGLGRELDRAVPGAVAPFEIEAGGVGTFPERGRPRALWLGLRETTGNLLALQARVETAVTAASIPGLKMEHRPFRPHLTLARFGESRPPAELAGALARHRDVVAGSFRVESVCLFESRLGPGGAAYLKLEEFRL